ncbi:nucleotidyltransferase family protein, partial [bacterium]|nr:nucleotidyltransferase family protein [bacterium]
MTNHWDRNHLPRELLCRVLLKLAAGATVESLTSRWFEAAVSLANPNTKYWNRLIIPIYSNLKQSGGLDQLPVVERAVIQNKFMQLLVLQIRQQSWLNKTISELIANEIPVILLKGAAAI